jgi:hypothetical protein
MRLDHLAVTATDLDEGTAAVEAALGVPLVPGGQHPNMATHNRLLGLGDVYLEVIAPDPAQPRPPHPRWFRMDERAGTGLTNWICATDDLDAALAAAPPGTGIATPLTRGAYRWRFAVPPDGRLPFDDAHPALIEWQGDLHPARALPDSGVRLARLTIRHPQAAALRACLVGLQDPRVVITEGPLHLGAAFDTPHGRRTLQAPICAAHRKFN